MRPEIQEVLAFIGMVTLWALGCGLIIGLYYAIKDLIDYLKRQYQYKHRFDKPPTAACYCKDCKRHGTEQHKNANRCYKFEGWYTADEWFCWDAEPREK